MGCDQLMARTLCIFLFLDALTCYIILYSLLLLYNLSYKHPPNQQDDRKSNKQADEVGGQADRRAHGQNSGGRRADRYLEGSSLPEIRNACTTQQCSAKVRPNRASIFLILLLPPLPAVIEMVLMDGTLLCAPTAFLPKGNS